MNEKQMAKADFVTSILLILVSLFIMEESYFRIPRFKEWGGFYATPGFTPFLLGTCLFLMSIYLWIRSLRRHGHQIRVTGEGVIRFFHSPKVIRFLICLGLFALYYAFLGRIPFVLDTGIYLFLSILIYKGSRWFFALLIAGATSFAIYFIFTKVFLVPLP